MCNRKFFLIFPFLSFCTYPCFLKEECDNVQKNYYNKETHLQCILVNLHSTKKTQSKYKLCISQNTIIFLCNIISILIKQTDITLFTKETIDVSTHTNWKKKHNLNVLVLILVDNTGKDSDFKTSILYVKLVNSTLSKYWCPSGVHIGTNTV